MFHRGRVIIKTITFLMIKKRCKFLSENENQSMTPKQNDCMCQPCLWAPLNIWSLEYLSRMITFVIIYVCNRWNSLFNM